MTNDGTCEHSILASSKIAIWGLGLMGGSLALALHGRCASLLAVDHDPDTLSLAQERQIVDYISLNPKDVLPWADAIILATPIPVILQSLQQLPEVHPGEAIVLDIGSTKSQIVHAMNELPQRFDPIGGHPICGKETSKLENAQADLYRGARFVFTPLSRTSKRAKMFAEQLALNLGSKPLWMEPSIHDQWIALTSHLPHLVALALASSTPSSVAPLIGPSFRDMTRIVNSPTHLICEMLMTNQQNLLLALQRFRQHLDWLEEKLREHDEQEFEESIRQIGEHLRTILFDFEEVCH